ncbi:membrane-spanning 4-domains subfamily A member 14 isoform X1 [Canis lupus familiaris]|uniref:membrane-spanning 4-domains subfamily A member 14 isoform X1 n=1 Tax=Canis lupus familiaris TaxID=9615 RepID=UPI0018F3B1A6|nr:membrane-spanning 4-domains subfamily A member 14 isoform X1 [Canis lupus familiaris]
MESSSEVKRSAHVITIQPNDTILTAFPYGPQSSLLDFLKGEPKVLGALQILLASIIVGVGSIFAFNYINFSQRFPLVFLTGYPFWGALIVNNILISQVYTLSCAYHKRSYHLSPDISTEYVITGYLTGINDKAKCMGQGVTAMNVISSLVAVAGIILTIISYRYQHKYCQTPSLEGICVIGRVLYNGILSVLLIISIAELSIAVTIVSFRSKCWTNSNEIVFFLPSDVTQDSSLSAPEENAAIQFEFHEQSSTNDSISNTQPVFIGGYTFFKLRISKNPLTFRYSRRRGSNTYYTSSESVLDEQRKSIPPLSQLYEEETKLKLFPPASKKKPTENILPTTQIKDEDLKSAITQLAKKQTQLQQSQALPSQVSPSYSVKKPQQLSPKDFPSQALPAQVLVSEAPKPHFMQPHGLTSEDMPYQDISSEDQQSLGIAHQNSPYQDISSQNIPYQNMLSPHLPPQDIPNQNLLSQIQTLPTQVMLFEAPTFHAAQSSNIQRLNQQSLELQQQNQQYMQAAYQDMQSEVKLLTQEWKSKEDFHSRKSSKWQSLDWQNENSQSLKSPNLEQQNKSLQSPKQKAPDQQIQGQQSLKRKSLDQHIKDWLSPKRHSIDKQIQVKQDRQQHLDQQAEVQVVQWEQLQRQGEDQQDGEKQSPMRQHKERQDKALQVYKGQAIKKQSKYQQTEDLQVQEEKSLKQPHQDGQLQIQEHQGWQFSGQQSQDWKAQGWRSKDWKVQEMQLEMPHSLKWESQIQQTQDLLEKESLKQKALHQDVQAVHAITRPQQLQSIPFQDSQYQDKHQQDLKYTDTQKEDMHTNTMQTDNKSEDMKSESQNLYNLQMEDKKPDCNCSSCQSSVQDTHFTSTSDINSEQDVQKNISICSTTYQEDITLTTTSCYPKDQQHSEDSD